MIDVRTYGRISDDQPADSAYAAYSACMDSAHDCPDVWTLTRTEMSWLMDAMTLRRYDETEPMRQRRVRRLVESASHGVPGRSSTLIGVPVRIRPLIAQENP